MEIIKLQQLQNDFNSVIEKSLNQKHTIETEIKEVLDFVNTIPNQKLFRKPIQSEFKTIRTISIFKINICDRKLLSDTFYAIKETGSFNDLSRTVDNTEVTQFKTNSIKQASELFEYYKWLNKLLSAPQKVEKKNGLSHKQKILALHYLGFDMMKFNQTKTGFVLEEVLGLNAKNTTDYIRYVSAGKNDVRTLENLTKVKQLFEKQGLYDIADKIESEIPKTK